MEIAPFLSLFAVILALLARLDVRVASALLLLSVLLALASGTVTPLGLVWLLLGLGLLAGAVSGRTPRALSRWLTLALAVLAALLFVRALPGFPAQVLADAFGRDATGAVVWTYDKGLAGALLTWLHQARTRAARRPRDWARWGCLAGGTLAVLAAGWAVGLATLDPRWLPGMAYWIVGNLFLTIVAEEALFRGMLQRKLEEGLRRVGRWAFPLALVLSAVAFGLAHLPWGAALAAVAALAGVFYGAMYGRDHALVWAVAAHASTNVAIITLSASPFG